MLVFWQLQDATPNQTQTNMKHPYTQKELAAFVDAGRTIVVKYKSAANIAWSHGTGQFILRPMPQKAINLPFTPRGRVAAQTPENFEKMLQF
jgi:hypothetical protein